MPSHRYAWCLIMLQANNPTGSENSVDNSMNVTLVLSSSGIAQGLSPQNPRSTSRETALAQGTHN